MGRCRSVCLVASSCAAILMIPARASAGDIYVAAGASLQTAINNAQPGDRLLLEPGATFTGNFRLPNKGASTSYITIRSSAADTRLPLDGVRIRPTDAVNLPVIKSPNTIPAMTAAAGAHHWRLQFLEFRANDRGYGDIIALGAGDTTQTLLSQVPHDLVLDRLYIHGDPVIGQKRGVSLHSGATWVLNCYISDIKGIGMDTQAIMGFNGPGPYTIANNYLEAAGENFLLGGADPKILNLIPSDIEFRGNHLFKPLAWRSPIIATPAGVTASGGTGGSLPAATYSYRVVASRSTAQDAWAYSARSAEVTVVVASGGRTTISWAPVANATTYRVYRGGAPGAQDRYFKTTATTFEDDGSAAGIVDSGTSMTGTVWSVKNLFELKNGQRIRVSGNLMENCWKQSQVGYAVLFTPRNQSGTAPWTYVRDVEFTGNLVRHAGSGVQIEGRDTEASSQLTIRLTIANNVFDDISATRWGGDGRWIQIGHGPSDVTIDHNTVIHTGHVVYVYGGAYGAENQVPNFRFTNNLVKHNTYGIMGDARGYGIDTLNAYFPGAVIERNTFAGGSSSRYPPGNEFPTVTYWQGQFVNFAASDFHLIDASPYRSSGTDALDLGAAVSQVVADATAALTGSNAMMPPAPVAITTTILPGGRTGTPYTATLTATGGSGTYAWSVASGALPPGVSLAATTGVLSGTPTQSGTFAVTVSTRDAADATNTASQAYALSIASTPPVVELTSPASGATVAGTTVTFAAVASDPDGTVTRVDFYANGTVRGTAFAAPWSLTWQDVAAGVYRLTAVATDDSGLTTTSGAVDITVRDDDPGDLVVSSLTAPSIGGAGASMMVTEVTSNQGASVAEPSSTGLYLSTSPSLGSAAVLLGTRTVPPLSAAGADTASTSVIVPAGTATGLYFVIARADVNGTVPESQEANNTKWALIRIGPDLAVAALTAPASAAAGSVIAVSDTTSNAGGGSAGASVTRFYLSINAAVDAGDVLLGSRSIGPLAAAASSVSSSSLTIPATTPGGVYYILAAADANAQVVETTEQNNTRASGQIAIGADLMISALAAPSTAGAGMPFTVTETTKNSGAGPAPASQTAFYLSTNLQVDAADVLIGARPVPPLGAGAVSTAATTTTIPTGVATGTYYVLARADALSAIAEGNEINNLRGSVKVGVGPDLTVATLTAPLTAAAGSAVSISDTTRNAGGGAAAASLTKYYLSANPVFDAGDALLGSRAVAALSAGASNTAATLVTLPAGLNTASFYLFAVADADSQVTELVEANTSRAVPVSVTAKR
jgi:subtilase family serine protease